MEEIDDKTKARPEDAGEAKAAQAPTRQFRNEQIQTRHVIVTERGREYTFLFKTIGTRRNRLGTLVLYFAKGGDFNGLTLTSIKHRLETHERPHVSRSHPDRHVHETRTVSWKADKPTVISRDEQVSIFEAEGQVASGGGTERGVLLSRTISGDAINAAFAANNTTEGQIKFLAQYLPPEFNLVAVE